MTYFLTIPFDLLTGQPYPFTYLPGATKVKSTRNPAAVIVESEVKVKVTISEDEMIAPGCKNKT